MNSASWADVDNGAVVMGSIAFLQVAMEGLIVTHCHDACVAFLFQCCEYFKQVITGRARAIVAINVAHAPHLHHGGRGGGGAKLCIVAVIIIQIERVVVAHGAAPLPYMGAGDWVPAVVRAHPFVHKWFDLIENFCRRQIRHGYIPHTQLSVYFYDVTFDCINYALYLQL
jgi:hypothetical protein